MTYICRISLYYSKYGQSAFQENNFHVYLMASHTTPKKLVSLIDRMASVETQTLIGHLPVWTNLSNMMKCSPLHQK